MSDAQLDFLSERLAHAWAQHTSGDYVTPISKLSRFIVVINRQQRGDFRNNWTARSKSHFRRSASKVLEEKSCWPNIFIHLADFLRRWKREGAGDVCFLKELHDLLHKRTTHSARTIMCAVSSPNTNHCVWFETSGMINSRLNSAGEFTYGQAAVKWFLLSVLIRADRCVAAALPSARI